MLKEVLRMYYDDLSERKKTILKAVVEAHIDGGEPVGSKYIVQNNLLSCSSKIKSATISIVSPSICHGVMGPDAMILVF